MPAFASLQQTRAILWAQWRSLRNFLPRRNIAGIALGSLLSLLTYGAFLVLSVFAAVLLMRASLPGLAGYLPLGFFFVFLYWQAMPLFMAAGGLSLEMKKLLPYPIPAGALFGLEVLLRLSAGIEVLIVLAGVFTGLLCNPSVPLWGPLWLLPFALFNLLLSVGVRDLLVRLLARKGIREIAAFLLVMLAVLPRLVAYRLSSRDEMPAWFLALRHAAGRIVWPWTAAASLATGQMDVAQAAALAGWIVLAYVFARRQFDKAIRIEPSDSPAAVSSGKSAGRRTWTEVFYRFPGYLWRDPVAAIVEKELRTLSRSSRFRLVFLMGFSFGLVIWIPLNHGGKGLVAGHFLTVVSVYAVLLLSDNLFCNALGFDRSAAQFYFVAPSGLRAALKGKNLAAVFFLFLEIGMVTAACLVLRMPVTAGMLLESYSVAAVFAILLLTIGNYTSLLQPRPTDPASSFRNSSGRGKVQLVLLIAFPLAALPVGLAYLADYAFDSRAAFFGVLAVDAAIGLVVYRLGLDSAVARGERDSEILAATLSQGAGPVSN